MHLAGWLLAALCLSSPVRADIFDLAFADVTTRAFSVVWVAEEAVTDATVRVFADAEGLDEITETLELAVPSAAVPLAHEQGIVKVEASGLDSDTEVYVQTETVTAGGTELYPPTPPFLAVRTAVLTRKANAENAPIVNDLIGHDLLAPDGQDPAEGALLLVSVPGLSAYPVSTFVGQGIPLPTALADLNNLFEAATGASAELAGGEALRLSEYRGRQCPMDAQEQVRFRRVPAHEEIPPITELEAPGACFAGADFTCDGCVGPGDFSEFLSKFGLVNDPPDCRFNPDFDLNADNRIDPGDFSQLLFVFGTCE